MCSFFVLHKQMLKVNFETNVNLAKYNLLLGQLLVFYLLISFCCYHSLNLLTCMYYCKSINYIRGCHAASHRRAMFSPSFVVFK